ncbi:MAG: class I SAM-dependent methyltransferase [Candidatus Thorarchaeota archaeon]
MSDEPQKTKIDQRSLQETYNEIAAEFDGTRYKPWPQTIDFINELPDNCSILDLGCGNGRNSLYIASLARGFKILAIDFSLKMLRIAINKTQQQKLDNNIEFIQGDIVKLPFTTSSIDNAIFIATLHHLPSEELRLQSLNDLERCLKPDGKAFISVWDFEQERFENELAKQLKEPPTETEFGDVFVPWTGKRGANAQRFYHLFYKDEFESLFNKTNFKIEKLFRAADNYHAVLRK